MKGFHGVMFVIIIVVSTMAKRDASAITDEENTNRVTTVFTEAVEGLSHPMLLSI